MLSPCKFILYYPMQSSTVLLMSQSRVKLGRTVLRLKKTGYSTWNIIKNGPKITVLLVSQPKVFFVSQSWWPTFLKKTLWATFHKILSYAPADFYYPFKPFNILNFTMKEWFCYVTCFVNGVLLLFFFSQTWYFYHKKVIL